MKLKIWSKAQNLMEIPFITAASSKILKQMHSFMRKRQKKWQESKILRKVENFTKAL